MNTLWRTLAIVLMMGNAYAQSDLPPCLGSSSNYWTNCFGTFNYSDGAKYVGEFKDNKRNGQGTFTYADGAKYIGDYKDNKRNGQGTFTHPDGAKYVGEWTDEKRDGYGAMYASNGTVTNKGIWANDKFVRSTQATVISGSAYAQSKLSPCSGTNTSDWINCFGTYTTAKGNKYVGEFKKGKFNGQGTYTFASGDKYVGEFKDGQRNGQGTFTFASGDKFVGEYKDGQRNGQGTYTFADGDKYVGDFKDGNFNGQGTMYASNGTVTNQGIWENDKFVRSVQATQPVATSTAAKRIALVIGNANYKRSPLNSPRNDADDMSRSLRSSGFEVIDLRDATLKQMRAGVRQFGDRLINNDVGLVYFSGHGKEVNGRNYFIPVDDDIMRDDEVADQGLDMSLILDKMTTAGKGVNILIVDACRSNPTKAFNSTSRGLAQMDAPRGTIIAYATSPGKTAEDGTGRNSPYTKHLVKAMQQPNKPIEQVFKEVRRAVQEETNNQQTTWENTSLTGDFYFKVQR